ncbi:hypothetical protein EMIHUDRAFT_465005 [Emiliania huxleyi CCMP1516]|uniref:PPPDE domain-containing protein n=2 Tax=Emiliania huxleyi TaxID=2903 RepID=A0A0D3ID33_EMIH1|nr:hypothetical protein EMIHUDRAFT_471030 [Emiliania huxleyi CCMP1516]XP_005763995.1 hypothetical protein EMIHUDRAFT_465005 [Emiliania huxleyi CCMP1516]EOD09168.1 hypothetical protein EMIHUDRAFT_471030 [Emiliania huxleyi CCMP1516]EOD11566.1 hypothetical protein EMIHUDRAFT_465005 [Emiliania huxleyi CCMP1516]|eukprot:XP_005761597.1 hypothetical protein EMIHUDRAFT_471030 [Emiliania huxleyi CCMP1516]
MNAFFLASTAFQPGSRAPAAPVLRHASPLAVFRTPGSTDQAVADQQRRAEAAGLTPKEYEEATRRAAKEYLDASGAHAMPADGSAAAQRASFLPQLWGVDSIPAVPAEAAADEARVLATFYEIGGPLTSVLSTSVAKQLPMIPHVGIRVHGVEYFYSDHIECRTVTIDLGPSLLGKDEVEGLVGSLEATWDADAYHVFDKNCVHFSDALAARVSEGGLPQPLVQGVLDVSERMLDSLPEWRRALGRRVMNEVTRLVVVSWGKASKEKKERVADDLGVERGA